ncbi:hypothetical protein WP50_01220 [Lactiplantibacillus plantarum]|nr:hypothetical protein WP50_01220 [Lactiplantibacillus plantarum]
MFTGVIEGVGPRYCPSIEDKIVRFADKKRHQLFLEPEGRNTDEWYVQGLSTSMPEEVQQRILHSIKGLEDAEMMRPGYAIEYDGNTIDYSVTEEQPGDPEPHHFSFETKDADYIDLKHQLSCWLTYTNETTHKIIRENLDRAPMFTGVIEGVGPRYCPSIEDKIVRFADKKRHQLFLEPEGRNTDEWYVQGLSTSMPEEVQQRILHSIKGLEDAEMMRPGYAIEYDGNTIDYSVTEEQPGDPEPHHFSFETKDADYIDLKHQLSCWLTYTNETTHKIIRENLDRAPMFTGVIEGLVQRSYPSSADKIV